MQLFSLLMGSEMLNRSLTWVFLGHSDNRIPKIFLVGSKVIVKWQLSQQLSILNEVVKTKMYDVKLSFDMQTNTITVYRIFLLL